MLVVLRRSNPCRMLSIEPARLYSTFRAAVAFVEVIVGMVVVSMGAVKLPAPIVASGVKLLSFHPSVLSRRCSIPALNACWPRTKLTVSAYVDNGLHDPRVEPKPALKFMKPCEKSWGTTCIGMPLYCGSSLKASLPWSVVASPLSRSRPTYHGAHCAMSCPRYPHRPSFTMLLANVDTNDRLYSCGRLRIAPL